MNLKKLFILAGVIGGVAYLQDKRRRERALTGARDLLDKVKTRARSVSSEVQSKMESAKGAINEEIKKDEYGRTLGGTPYSGVTPPTTYR